MHVGVEEACRDRLPQESMDERARERRQIVARVDQRLAVGQLDAVDPFERQHAPRGALPIDRGDVILRLGLHHLREFGRRGGLAAQIKLARGPALEGLRSEEHTSELQSLMRISYAVFCLKKKKNN